MESHFILKMNIRNIVIILSFSWLVFCAAFTLGVYVYSARIWPYPVISAVENFITGDSAESTTVVEKLMNDFDFKPTRQIVHNTKLFKSRHYHELTGIGLSDKRKKPLVYFSPDAQPGYRVLYGVFDFKAGLHGAILFGPDGEVKHIWHTTQEGVEWSHQPDSNVYPHGFEIDRDASIITAYDAGTSMTKYDPCGNVIWRIKGGYHHSISLDDQGTLWSWGKENSDNPYGQHLVQIESDTGNVLRQFNLYQVYEANPDVDILGIMQADTHEKSTWLFDLPGDMWHINDIEPLPEKLKEYYPQFNAGDLLVSLRSPNLIFVLDPDTYRIKWWRQGLTRRQHDPDFNDQGTISIFNNNMHRGFSSIVDLNPVTFESKKVVDGEKYGFYTWIRGKHQRLPDGGYIITSTEQGRVFEVNHKGEVTFEFVNAYSSNNEQLPVSEARFLPLDFFTEWDVKGWEKCNTK
ncbi:putative Lipoprotein [Desulfamplus magnetovallimortis]|uniref:Putative Lipoprotein n=1 Tax=Desulfamplus magnetovallimortis TaxID=1246637 RepID=A0A1W1HC52_9BACT|nr:arylsulfotransferase family protein [Desulfamplus magnetovallimortis]SLM29965.1 putative Lipoprotein [Desulfamplus magnetovallimortis]